MNKTQELQEKKQKALKSLGELLNNTADHYNQPRIEGEIDLVEIVRERMVEKGLGSLLPAAFDSNRFIIEAQGKTSSAQQYNLNRWLTLQLMASTHDTALQRYALIYEINAVEWLKVFDNVILPALVDFDLPVVI